MADYQLSCAEKTFVIHGIQGDMREDGRSCDDYRQIEVVTDIVSNANGSARLSLADTDILVGVKAEVCAPSPDCDDRGLIQFFVDCSANASPLFEGRGGESLSTEIANCLQKAYVNEQSLDLKALCISRGNHVWMLHVDIVVLEFGGNVFDAVSIAVKAALYSTRLPVLTVTVDGGVTELDVTDDPYNVVRLDVSRTPVIITLTKISDRHIVDATLKEEACSIARLAMAVTDKGLVTFTKSQGSGSLQIESVNEMLQTGRKVGKEVNVKLMKVLQLEEKTDANKYDRQSTFLKS